MNISSIALLSLSSLICSSALLYGCYTILRDHNSLMIKKEFKKRQKRYRLSLRAIEDELSFVLIPQLQTICTQLELDSENIPIETYQRKLKAVELNLMRILERCDELNPSLLIVEPKISDDELVVISGEYDRGSMLEAVEIFRSKKRCLIVKVHALMKQLDSVCESNGISIQ